MPLEIVLSYGIRIKTSKEELKLRHFRIDENYKINGWIDGEFRSIYFRGADVVCVIE